MNLTTQQHREYSRWEATERHLLIFRSVDCSFKNHSLWAGGGVEFGKGGLEGAVKVSVHLQPLLEQVAYLEISIVLQPQAYLYALALLLSDRNSDNNTINLK